MRTAKPAARVAEPVALTDAEHGPEDGVMFESEVVIREKGRIPFGDNGLTLGQVLDQQLAMHAKHDGEPRIISFSFDAKSWAKAKEAYKDWEDRSSY